MHNDRRLIVPMVVAILLCGCDQSTPPQAHSANEKSTDQTSSAEDKPIDKLVEMRPADEAEFLRAPEIMAKEIENAPNDIVRDEVQKKADIARCSKRNSFQHFSNWTGSVFVIREASDDPDAIEFSVHLNRHTLGEELTGTISKSSSLYSTIRKLKSGTISSGFFGSDVAISGTIDQYELGLTDEEAKAPEAVAQATSQCGGWLSYKAHFTEIKPL